jgi:cell division initiation protein
MMDLTPIEIRKKKGDFRRQLRGYDPAQVDDFLDVVGDRLEQVVRENIGMAERLTRLEQQVADFRDRERAMTEALVTAQQMRDQMRSQVEKEVELAKRQAVQDAEHIRTEAAQEAEREEENILRLRQRQRQLLQSFRTFLERELSELQVFSKALELDEAVPDEARVRTRRGSGRSRGGRSDAVTAPPPEEEPEALPAGPSDVTAAPPRPAGQPSAERVPPFEEPFAAAEPDPLDALLGEGPAAVEDRPEPAEAAGAPSAPTAPAGRQAAETLRDVSEEEFGGLFTGWEDARPEPGAEDDEMLLSEEAAAGVSDDEFLDALLSDEPELVLSDEDVLEGTDEAMLAGAGAAESPAQDVDAFILDEELVLEDEVVAGEPDAAPETPRVLSDQPVDLTLLPDAEDLAGLNLDDLGLPPVPPRSKEESFGSSGLTLRPLSQEEEAPDVPRERERDRDDDDDMFSSLFGKPR